jgi:hypothetical protein
MENKRHHLLTIQAVIARLGVNSFLLKGWSVTLICALFALAADKSDHRFGYIALMPCFIFWSLDAYFLWQERLFRRLYDLDRVKVEKDIDFSLHTGPVLKQETLAGAFFSQTLLMFHFPLLVTIVLVIVLLTHT